MPRTSISGRIAVATITAAVAAAILAHAVRAAAPVVAAEPTGDLRLQLARALDPAEEDGRRKTRSKSDGLLRQELPSLFPSGRTDGDGSSLAESQLDAQGLTARLALWVMLQDDGSAPPFETFVNFVEAGPDWPGQSKLRLRAEQAIGPQTPDELIIRWFKERKPQTPAGAMTLARALLRNDDADAAVAALRDAWVRLDMDSRCLLYTSPSPRD